ncbi:hypothetical protein GQ54DRAFT_296963 [Martensiomyces pterosporus]|nr:hypothetical protein GQ54DRAFT_296963 [Martensiomyces pterosporus]
MPARGSTSKGSNVPSTPPRGNAPSPISTRLRSRVKSQSTLDEGDAADAPMTPTTTRGRRSVLRKTASEDHSEAPATPSRRSTRAAARKATDLIQDEVAELMGSRKRATRKAPASSAKKTTGASLAEEMLPATPTGKTTKASSHTRRVAKIEEEEEVAKKAPTGTNRPSKAAKKPSEESVATEGEKRGKTSLPPPHPDLAAAEEMPSAAAAAALDNSQFKSASQSADENYHTAPESPVKPDAGAPVAKENRSVSSAAVGTKGEEESFESEEDEISDLSDIDDPHFTEIMTSEAATAALSAAGSTPAASVHEDEEADAEERLEGAAEDASGSEPQAKSSHVVFDSDAEAESDSESDDEAATTAAPAGFAAKGADMDSDSDDEAPEVVSTKTAPRPEPVEANGRSETEAVVPAAKESEQQKTKKKHRARHRKRAVPATVVKDISTTMDNVARMKSRPGLFRPTEIPEELRLEEDAGLAEASSAPAAKRPTAGDRIDMSVLAEFAQESKKRAKDEADQDSEDGLAERRRKDKKRKKSKGKDSRVVSGIRVVSTRPAKKASLLETLSQKVPDTVRSFSKKKRGARGIKRSNPLVGIARHNNQPAINFFK